MIKVHDKQKLASANNFAIEQKKADRVVEWMNAYALKNKKSFYSSLESYPLYTKNFGEFEIVSWKGDWSVARNVLIKASNKMNAKVIESGYNQKGSFLHSLIGANKEYGKVYSNGNIIGLVIFGRRDGKWICTDEKRY